MPLSSPVTTGLPLNQGLLAVSQEAKKESPSTCKMACGKFVLEIFVTLSYEALGMFLIFYWLTILIEQRTWRIMSYQLAARAPLPNFNRIWLQGFAKYGKFVQDAVALRLVSRTLFAKFRQHLVNKCNQSKKNISEHLSIISERTFTGNLSLYLHKDEKVRCIAVPDSVNGDDPVLHACTRHHEDHSSVSNLNAPLAVTTGTPSE